MSASAFHQRQKERSSCGARGVERLQEGRIGRRGESITANERSYGLPRVR